MYTDPSNIRDHVIKLRLNDREHELVEAWVNYTGQQKATLLREMILEQAKIELGTDAIGIATGTEGPQGSLFKD